MSTKASTLEHIVSQLDHLPDIMAKKMFGEYALYYEGKVFALICDDMLFLKKTEVSTKFIPNPSDIQPFPKAKNYVMVPNDKLKNKEWLAEFVVETVRGLKEKAKSK